MEDKSPGWDSKAIRDVAMNRYGGLTAMFIAHKWDQRGADMLMCVQRLVAERYGSVEEFVEFHKLPTV